MIYLNLRFLPFDTLISTQIKAQISPNLETFYLGRFVIILVFLLAICLEPILAQNTAERAIEEKIQNALSAAPEYIAREAAVWDWPAEEGSESLVLRDGSNNWTCLPDYPETPGNDPMCHDEVFLEWHLAAMQQKEPDINRVGLSYMLAGGGFVDDEAEPVLGPHVMIALPTLTDGKGIPHLEYSEASQQADAPHIYHGGTPYEIIIMPVAAAGEKIQVISQKVHN